MTHRLITIEEGIEQLKLQKVIIYPTEGVYGIGADARNDQLSKKICDIKLRSYEKGLIALADSLDRIKDWIQPLSTPQKEKLFIEDSGFNHTWLLPKTRECPSILTGGTDTLAVRLTSHTVARALCTGFKGAITSTSANLQGAASIILQSEALKFAEEHDLYVVDGELGGTYQATKIQHVITGEVFRL